MDKFGNIYVTNVNANSVIKYNSSGTSVLTITGLNLPRAIALDNSGNIYVANYGANQILKYSSSGGSPILTITSGVVAPQGVAVDISGNIYSANSEANNVTKYSSSGGLPILTISQSGTLFNTTGVAVDGLGKLYVANYGNSFVAVYNYNNGAAITTIDISNSAYGIALDYESSVYIATYQTNRVLKYTNYYAGTAPIINNVTNQNELLCIYFTPGTGARPSITTYHYSLDGGTTYADALSNTSPLVIPAQYNNSYRIVIKAYTGYIFSVNSNMVEYSIKYPCFLQGTKILTMNPETDEEEYIPIENLRRGDLIKTVNGYKAIELIGFREIHNPLDIPKKSSRLYWFRKSKITELKEDLCVTGDHCVLHKSITNEKREQVLEYMGKIYVTDGHYRVPAFLDERSEKYKSSGPATIWHFALENSNVYYNYGVMANGLLVESNCIYCMYNDSNMTLI